ncbi:hypothetical protein [Pseudomonas sp. Z18(2022)]|uniref:hypothetical protein n=1 Tax=Pseudomonas sp. Z18(2022) TaxID=2983410 RepID=UPI002E81B1F9|nr:hypothetical protein [Pseudomonas sp. Z18(2022)]
MTSVVLTYKGPPSMRKEAESRLRQKLQGADFVCRATDLFEAQVDERQLSIIAGESQWQVTFPSYAEIRRPGTNWSTLREKVLGMK